MEYDWEQWKIRSTPILPSNHHPFISVGKYPRTGKKIRSNFTEESNGVAGESEETFSISARAPPDLLDSSSMQFLVVDRLSALK